MNNCTYKYLKNEEYFASFLCQHRHCSLGMEIAEYKCCTYVFSAAYQLSYKVPYLSVSAMIPGQS